MKQQVPIFIFIALMMYSCMWPPVVFHADRTGNKSMICFKKACRKKTHNHIQRRKSAKERLKDRRRLLAKGDTLPRRAVTFNKLVEADKNKNVIEEVEKEVNENLDWEEDQTFILDHIYFETGSSKLLADSYDELDELADWLIRNERSIIEIAGHTDNIGDEAINEKLSKDRVKSVWYYLTKVKGIKRNRLLVKGYGSSNPIASNETKEGRKQNRRVEFTILKK